jgi:HAD superfamily hydrolase (TIGR01509 family)
MREKGSSATMTTLILRRDGAHHRLGVPSAATHARWPLRGLIFDMGDVLYDATPWRRWLLAVLRQLGVADDYGTLFDLWDRQYLNDIHRGRRDYQPAFAAFLSKLGLAAPQIDEVCAASSGRKHELAESLRPLPGVRPTLERLRAEGFLLGVLSDSEDGSPRLWQRLEMLGLAPSITAVVSSRDIECTKPSPEAYQTILAALRLTAAQAAFVGHDDDELRGAAAVGLKSIAFNHGEGAAADAYLSRFEELPDLISYCEDQAVAAA